MKDSRLERSFWVQLIRPKNVLDFYLSLIREGHVNDACIVSRHFPELSMFASTLQLYETIKFIPRDISTEELIQWVEKDMMPYLFKSLSIYTAQEEIVQNIVLCIKVSNYFSEWAKDYEELDCNPFRAAIISKFASLITKTTLGVHDSFPIWPDIPWQVSKMKNCTHF